MDERIKTLRKFLGLTQQEFADSINVERSTVANYELGKRTPKNAVISLICGKYGVSEEWLRTGKGEMLVPMDRREEITKALTAMMREEPNPFKEKLILALLRIPSDKWTLIEQAARDILSENEKSRDD